MSSKGWRKSDAPLLLSAAALSFAGCPLPEDILPSGGPWAAHVIEDRFVGADGVKLGDVNGDGWMDLAVPWEESGIVTVHLNPGPSQAKQHWPTVQLGAVGAVEDAVFVDLDADGNLDVVSCSQGSVKTMHVHWAPADRSRYMDATAWETEAIPVTRGVGKWMFCEPAQIDTQHGMDLVAGTRGDNGQVGWLEAPENPRDLAAWQWHPLSSAGWTMSLVPVDLDDDGLVDVVVSDRAGPARGCYWMVNPGPGLLQKLPWPIQRISSTADALMFMDVADLDSDDRFEIVLTTDRREAIWHRPTESLGLAWGTSRISWPDRFGTGKGVRIADIDVDGRADIVFTCENAGGKYGVGWLSRRSLGGVDFWFAQPISGMAGSKFDLVQVLDLDDDGDLDVITCEEAAALGVLWYENPTIAGPNTNRSP